MRKLFACFALFCLIGTAFSAVDDDCDDNSLLTVYGFTKSAKEVSGTAFKYCKSLQGGTSCCAASIVDTFQTRVEALAETLVEFVIKRDTAIVTLRDTTIPALATKLTALQTQATAAAAKLAADREDETYDPYSAADAETVATSLAELAEDANDNLDDATKGFTAFQKARSACVVEILGLQAAAWCLACDPTALDQGVGLLGAIDIADDTCTRLKGACYDYVTASVAQSSILTVGWVSDIIEDLNEALEDVAGASTEAEATAALQAFADAAGPAEAPENEAMPVVLPTGCTSEAACEWICDNLFVEGEIVEGLLVVGGTPAETPIIAPDVAEVRRRLVGTWEPAADEAGVTIDWEDDPADVNSEDDTVTPAGAGIIKGGFVCVIALLSVFFF